MLCSLSVHAEGLASRHYSYMFYRRASLTAFSAKTQKVIMCCDLQALNNCAFRCRLNCPLASHLSQISRQTVPQARSHDSETSVAKTGTHPRNSQYQTEGEWRW